MSLSFWSFRSCHRYCQHHKKRVHCTPAKAQARSFCVDKHTAFRDLKLKQLKYEESYGRVRQHVNPLSLRYQQKTEALEWNEVYENPNLPLILDAGSGAGRFPLLAALRDQGQFNYLGTEIRQPLIGRANFWARELDVSKRVHFVFCNVTISLDSLLEGYPGPIHGIYIQFPDPLFKKRQRKRHMVQPAFVKVAAQILKPGGVVFTQSDVESCAVYMRQMFEAHGMESFQPCATHTLTENRDPESEFIWDGLSWLENNPIGYPTEREIASLEQGSKVYRMLLMRV